MKERSEIYNCQTPDNDAAKNGTKKLQLERHIDESQQLIYTIVVVETLLDGTNAIVVKNTPARSV